MRGEPHGRPLISTTGVAQTSVGALFLWVLESLFSKEEYLANSMDSIFWCRYARGGYGRRAAWTRAGWSRRPRDHRIANGCNPAHPGPTGLADGDHAKCRRATDLGRAVTRLGQQAQSQLGR